MANPLVRVVYIAHGLLNARTSLFVVVCAMLFIGIQKARGKMPHPASRAIGRGEFIEYARVHSNIYGTSIKAVEAVQAKGKTCLLDIDVQGAELVKKTNLNAKFIFVAPPSFEELERRLRGRGTETEDKIQTRLKNAKGEMDYMDKPGFFDLIIVNDDLEKAYANFKAVCKA